MPAQFLTYPPCRTEADGTKHFWPLLLHNYLATYGDPTILPLPQLNLNANLGFVNQGVTPWFLCSSFFSSQNTSIPHCSPDYLVSISLDTRDLQRYLAPSLCKSNALLLGEESNCVTGVYICGEEGTVFASPLSCTLFMKSQGAIFVL